MNLSFEAKYQQFQKELLPLLRTDEELWDLFFLSPIESMELLINRDFGVFFKPYVLGEWSVILSALEKAKHDFTFFYQNINLSLHHKDIVVSMIRYFLFLGSHRKILTIFLELYKKKQINDWLLIICYFLSMEIDDLSNYHVFINKVFENRIKGILEKNTFLFSTIYEKKELIRNYFSFKDFLDVYVSASQNFQEKHIIYLHSWFFTQALLLGNYFVAYRFLQWSIKNFKTHFSREYFNSLKFKLGLIFAIHHKFFFIKKEKVFDFPSTEKEVFLNNIHTYFSLLDKNDFEKKIVSLTFDFHLFDFLSLYHFFFEEIFLDNFEIYNIKTNSWKEKKLNYLPTQEIKINPEEFSKFLKLQTHSNIEEFFIKNKGYLFFLNRYKKILPSYMGYFPLIKFLIGILYESYQPSKTLEFYKSNPHPLVKLRMEHLKNQYRNEFSKSQTENKIIKKIEKLNPNIFMTDKIEI
ncbi:MAG: hypothetical protein NZ853_05310 [Leptospiraceae bacterium]|nr:hypothetical protein [Leptospiraceae bacterium]MDW7976634.1 hypothetical protein [Leptospiraceae bacterium]